MSKRFLTGFAAAALLAVLAAGCSDDEGDGGTVVQEHKAGGIDAQVGMGLNLPDGFPADVAIYPGMQVFSSSTVPQGVAVHATSAESVDTVAAFIKDNMVGNGWTDATDASQSAGMTILQFNKPGRTTGINLLPGANNGTTIQITALSTE